MGHLTFHIARVSLSHLDYFWGGENLKNWEQHFPHSKYWFSANMLQLKSKTFHEVLVRGCGKATTNKHHNTFY